MADDIQRSAEVYELASVPNRFFALLIDTIILGFVLGVAGVVFSGNFDFMINSEETALGGGATFVIGLLYNAFFWTRRDGQTPGKAIAGIRVIRKDGGRLSLVDSFLRHVGYYINTAALMLGWLWAVFDREAQGLHDKIASTYVVRD